jgi:hypothetical protein
MIGGGTAGIGDRRFGYNWMGTSLDDPKKRYTGDGSTWHATLWAALKEGHKRNVRHPLPRVCTPVVIEEWSGTIRKDEYRHADHTETVTTVVV